MKVDAPPLSEQKSKNHVLALVHGKDPGQAGQLLFALEDIDRMH